jgi:hypothetical protein
MITLPPSELASVARSLVFREIAEYVSEGLVGIACFGEYVAEYAKWPASWNEEQKRRLGRRSLILLIVGIGFSIIALIRTNALSGQVIGSLGQQAEDANRKAETAISSLNRALSDSQQALVASSNAVSQSNKADEAASSALGLAKGARKEADSFEHDIVAAKTQATEAESHLADAMQRAASATSALERLTSPRTLINSQQLVATLTTYKDTEYTFSAVYSDQESLQLLKNVDDVLKQAGWKRGMALSGYPAISVFGTNDPYSAPAALSNGIRISVDWPEGLNPLQSLPIDKLPQLIRAAVALNLTLSANLSPAEKTQSMVDIEKGDSKTIRIAVGKKPMD